MCRPQKRRQSRAIWGATYGKTLDDAHEAFKAISVLDGEALGVAILGALDSSRPSSEAVRHEGSAESVVFSSLLATFPSCLASSRQSDRLYDCCARLDTAIALNSIASPSRGRRMSASHGLTSPNWLSFPQEQQSEVLADRLGPSALVPKTLRRFSKELI